MNCLEGIIIAEVYPELTIIEVVLVIIATIVMAIVYQKRHDLIFWLLTYITLTIGVIISAITDITNPGGPGHFISRIFYVSASIILFIGVFKEYHEVFFKEKIENSKIRDIVCAVVVISPIIIILEGFIIIFCGICVIMLIRIFLEKKTFTHAFLSLSIFNVLLSLILTISESIGIEGMTLYSLGMNIIFFTTLLITAIVALLDQKIINTLNEKNYLKDKYSHDLGNTLHTISIAYDLLNIKDYSDITQHDLDKLIKLKIDEASDIVKFIRGL